MRAGLRALAAMGVVQSRHGSGTYIPDGPPSLGTEALSFLAALHGFTREEMYEARRILEVGAAGLAAERATPDQIATLAEEVAEPVRVDGRPAACSSCTTSTSIARSRRRRAIRSSPRSSRWCRRSTTSAGARRPTRASDRDLRDAADMHRRIYQAIRARDAEAARQAMHDAPDAGQRAPGAGAGRSRRRPRGARGAVPIRRRRRAPARRATTSA